MAALLLSGLGVREERVTVGSGREAWTLGAALAEVGRSELVARAPDAVRPAWRLAMGLSAAFRVVSGPFQTQ